MTRLRRFGTTAALLSALVLAVAWTAGCDDSPLNVLGGQDATPINFLGPLPSYLSFSPQSDALVFVRAGVLVTDRNLEKPDPRALTGSGEYDHPSWSPDGRYIVYEYRPDRFHQTNLMIRPSTATEVPKKLTDSYARDFLPLWSADGQWIAFHSSRTPAGSLWVMPANGGAPFHLGPAVSNERAHAWSRSGARLAYERRDGADANIWIADPLTRETRLFAGTAASEAHPVWRPDGKAVGFLSLAKNGWNVWAQEDADGAEPRQITNIGNVAGFDWARNGEAVMFLTSRGSLYFQNVADGSEPVKIQDARGFAISPDGRRYAYVYSVENFFRYRVESVPVEFQP